MKVLEQYGRLSVAIKPHLRIFVASKVNKNGYINKLIDDDYKRQSKKPSK